jgi:glycosyltransferase involved in cell wall biosynthesis
MTMLSVIIPIKDERDNVGPLHERLTTVLAPTGWDYELVIVDDGSADDSFQLLADVAARDDRVKLVRLRRNYGQTAALLAGIDWSRGDVLVTMDGDLQNDPADIPALLAKLDEGYDVVLGQRANRQDSFVIRKLPSIMANWLIRKVTNIPFKDFGCTLRALRRDVAESLPLYGEMHRFVPALALQHGARMAQIPVRHHPRRAGQTKYNLTRTVRVVLDLITVKFLSGYLTRPMHVLGTVGLGMMGLGVLSLVATIVMKWTQGIFLTGNPLLLLSVMLELIGIQFILMGLLGEVLARTYFESQGKTPYAVRTTRNLGTAPPKQRAA